MNVYTTSIPAENCIKIIKRMFIKPMGERSVGKFMLMFEDIFSNICVELHYCISYMGPYCKTKFRLLASETENANNDASKHTLNVSF